MINPITKLVLFFCKEIEPLPGIFEKRLFGKIYGSPFYGDRAGNNLIYYRNENKNNKNDIKLKKIFNELYSSHTKGDKS